MKLEQLSPARGAKKAKKRVGRGSGSGLGMTAGRGTKGQKSRSGGGTPPWFEGGQMPLQRRVPKRGFTNIFKKVFSIVNLQDLGRFPPESEVGPRELLAAGLIKKARQEIKLLAQGELPHPLVIKVHRASAAAVRKVEAAGGRVEVL